MTITLLLCPFALRNPKDHLSCLCRGPLRSVTTLRDHLVRHHARPPYCSVCGETFPTHRECDAHIVRRECELSAAPPAVEGLGTREVRVLEYWTSAHEGKVVGGEYKRVWEVVFPEVPVPDLSDGVGSVWRRAGEVRDWWGVNGARVMEECFDGEKVGKERLEMMWFGVLERMMRMVVEDEGKR